jgi:hypothetical protein
MPALSFFLGSFYRCQTQQVVTRISVFDERGMRRG